MSLPTFARAGRHRPLHAPLRTALFAASLLATGAVAAQSFVQIAPISGQTTLNGTLLATPVTITTSASTLAAAPSINPPYNAYDIWANAPTPLPVGYTPAAIYPPSAQGNPQLVIGSPGSATAAAPARLNVRFAQAMQDPVMLVYSIDNSVVDVSPTRQRDGSAPVASITGNPAAAINSAALTVGATVRNTGLVAAEGCWATQARACAVIRFSGSYTDISFNTYSVNGGQDGLGFQFGAAAYAPPAPVPAPAVAPLAAVGALLLGLVATARQARRRRA